MPCPTSFSIGSKRRPYASLTINNEMTASTPTPEDFEYYRNLSKKSSTTSTSVPVPSSTSLVDDPVPSKPSLLHPFSIPPATSDSIPPPAVSILSSTSSLPVNDSPISHPTSAAFLPVSDSDSALMNAKPASETSITSASSPSASIRATCTSDVSFQPDWMVQQLTEFGWPPEHWISPNADWNYLLNMKNFLPGKLICSLRGKLLLIAAGQVQFKNLFSTGPNPHNQVLDLYTACCRGQSCPGRALDGNET